MITARSLLPLALGVAIVGCGQDAVVGRFGQQPSGAGGQSGVGGQAGIAGAVASGGRGSGGEGGRPAGGALGGSAGGQASRPDGGPLDGSVDAAGPHDGGDGAVARCTVVVDGGAVPCTTTIAGAAAYDYFCGLKAGVLGCWGSTAIEPLVELVAPAVAAAPPNLVQVALSTDAPTDHSFCGLDESRHGYCWTDKSTRDLGTNLRAVSVSYLGACSLAMDGSFACDNGIAVVQSPPPYAQIVVSDDELFGLDQTGTPSFALFTFPAGTYTEIAANRDYRLGAVRSDGTAVTFLGNTPALRSGSYLHLALDDSGRACGIDQTGALSCWLTSSTSTASLFTNLPSGPFVQIVGGGASFCALRASGTTACWGDQEIIVPAGW